MSDYLFDKKGDVDEDVASLERALAPMRYRRRATPRPTPSARRPARIVAVTGAVVAALSLAAAALVGVGREAPPVAPAPPASAISVRALAGAPRLRGRVVGGRSAMPPGAWLETDASSRAEIALAELGQVRGRVVVAPSSRVSVSAVGHDTQRLELERGRLDAVVIAPPRLFVVGAPGGTAVDLGCAYSLEVVGEGRSQLRVRSGAVELGGEEASSWVPAGAVCETPVDARRGTPWFEDADPELVRALRAYEDGSDEALDRVVALARPRDTLTLWHLARRVPEALRGRVEARLVALAPPRAGVTTSDPRYLDDLVAHW